MSLASQLFDLLRERERERERERDGTIHPPQSSLTQCLNVLSFSPMRNLYLSENSMGSPFQFLKSNLMTSYLSRGYKVCHMFYALEIDVNQSPRFTDILSLSIFWIFPSKIGL